MSYIIFIPSYHEIVNEIQNEMASNMSSFFLPQYGLWCPIGERDLFKLEQKYKDTFKQKMGHWILEVVDEKKWLITKIKFGI